MAPTQAEDLFEAFDYTYSNDVSEPILRCMAFVRNNTGLLGDYNPGKARLDVSGNTVMVTARSSSMSAHNSLLSWVQEQPDLHIAYIGVKSMAGGDKHPHMEIKEL